MKSFIYGTLLILGVMACLCQAVPEPAVVPGPYEWTVEVRFEHPQQILLKAPEDNKPRRFWYIILTLTNDARLADGTRPDVDFYPEYELMTDTFEVIPAGRETPTVVFEQIKKRHQSRYPFLGPLEKAGNKILQGSNETVAIDHPVDRDQTGKPKKVFLRKSLELSYNLAGDPAFRSDARLRFKGKRWVMR